jgi:hypothetical protein
MPIRRIHLFDRRQLLRLGGAGLIAPLLPGCETLSLPERRNVLEIPPITPNPQFYVEHCCGRPEVDPDTWTLSIQANGTEFATLDMAFLDTLEVQEREHTLVCIGSTPRAPQISNAIWGGQPLLDVLGALGVEVPDTAVEQKWICADDYSTSLPIADLDKQWLVWWMNEISLPPIHGAPARVLSPGRFGTKNPKWPVVLDFVDEPYRGHWEVRGWSNEATYLPAMFVLGPVDMSIIDDETVQVLGTAFAGEDPVTLVEITTDGGETWEPVEITYSPGADIWTLWRYDWKPPGPGLYTLQARLTTESGAMSAPTAEATNRLAGYDGSMQISVEVV